jgi:hypothetical protein
MPFKTLLTPSRLLIAGLALSLAYTQWSNSRLESKLDEALVVNAQISGSLNTAVSFNAGLRSTVDNLSKSYQEALEIDLAAAQRNVTMDSNLEKALSDLAKDEDDEPINDVCSRDERISPANTERMQQYYDQITRGHNED